MKKAFIGDQVLNASVLQAPESYVQGMWYDVLSVTETQLSIHETVEARL